MIVVDVPGHLGQNCRCSWKEFSVLFTEIHSTAYLNRNIGAEFKMGTSDGDELWESKNENKVRVEK